MTSGAAHAPATMLRSLRAAPLLLLAAAAPAQPPAPRDTTPFDVERLADGVYAVVRRERTGLYFQSNATFIVGDSDVVVVDAQFSQGATREVLAALRRLTSKPVRYLVDTHFHDDHVTGNQVWRDAFPGLEIVGHANMAADMATVGAQNRAGMTRALPGLLGFFHERLATGTSVGGGPITDEERVAYAGDSALAARYLAEAPTLRVTPPTLTFTDRLTLARGGRTIEVRWLGAGHTRGDAVVWLPRERIVVAGDLVVWPVPTVGSTSFPGAFGATLDSLLALGATTIVPGHGPVLRDDAYVRDVSRLLASLRRQAEAAVARGETLEQARRSVDLREFRARFAGESQLRGVVFDNYVVSPGVAAAYREATAARDAARPKP
jgi:cyclase